jgi:hypothetical protein
MQVAEEGQPEADFEVHPGALLHVAPAQVVVERGLHGLDRRLDPPSKISCSSLST